jgi:hypothetical protein
MQLPEFTRSTTLRWTLPAAGIAAVFIVTSLRVCVPENDADLTTRSDRMIASQIGFFAELSPERRLEAIDEDRKPGSGSRPARRIVRRKRPPYRR